MAFHHHHNRAAHHFHLIKISTVYNTMLTLLWTLNPLWLIYRFRRRFDRAVNVAFPFLPNLKSYRKRPQLNVIYCIRILKQPFNKRIKTTWIIHAINFDWNVLNVKYKFCIEIYWINLLKQAAVSLLSSTEILFICKVEIRWIPIRKLFLVSLVFAYI